MVLINATLHTMRGEIIENGFIEIENGKIKNLGDMSELPEGEDQEILDLAGKDIYPGFIDAHTHLGMSENGVGDDGEDINEMSDPCTPHIRAVDAIDPMDETLKDAYTAGITTMITSPGSANAIAGQITAMKTYGTSVEKMAIAESFAMKFALGENPKRVYGDQDQQPMSRMATAAIIRENLAKAKRYMEDKERAVEQEENLPDLDFPYEALIPVLKREQKAHFHAHRAYDIMTAIRIAKEFNLDYVLIHCTEGYRIADELVKEKAKIVCGPLFGTRSKSELSRQTIENCSILRNAGLEIAISSDHPEVQSELLPLSAGVAMNYGLSKEDALLSLTYFAAKAVGLEHRIGSLGVGLDADLIVFSGEPLEIQSKPEYVFINGKSIL